MTKSLSMSNISVEFEDIKFLRATSLTKDVDVELVVVIQPGSGRFEISEKSTTLVTGIIKLVENPKLHEIQRNANSCILPNRDFYKELRLRGYHYNGLFRSVTEGSSDGLSGKVKWDYNWIAFLDCLLQIQILGKDTRSLMIPTSIQKMIIDPKRHLAIIEEFNEETPVLDVTLCPNLKIIRSGGIEIFNLEASIVGRRRPQGDPVLESYKFIPYHVRDEIETKDAVRVVIQMAIENSPIIHVKAVEVDTVNTEETILKEVQTALEGLPLITSNLIFLSHKVSEIDQIHIEDLTLSTQSDCFIIISTDCLSDFNFLEKASASFSDCGFLICRERSNVAMKNFKLPEGFTLISSIRTKDEILVVLSINKKPLEKKRSAIIIKEKDSSFEWIEKVKEAMKNGPLVLIAENEPTSGLIGLVNCLRKEPNESSISCVFIDDVNAPKFDIENSFYQNQIGLGLAINVLKDGSWGSYRHLQIQKINDQRSSVSHCFVNALVKSDLSSLKWISGPFNYSKPAGELVKIQYSALNFKDVMLATGKITAEVFCSNRFQHECVLGIEYSGVTASGRRVMGMTSSAALVQFLFLA